MVVEFRHRTGIKTYFKADGFSGRLSKDLETVLYRCLQESLTNVTRHADAGEVKISLQQCWKEVSLCVKDNGKGFDLSSLEFSGEQIGLKGMEERVTLLGGQLKINSSPGKGTEICITVPLFRCQERK